ncbi:MAG TPA: HAMP domain-containing sensor histidine kinase [Ktedonobacterales bacterium]|nr:HAMP domain-containing sensor histidine kinase [Ktedonobacterales bacterium]
MRSSASSGSSSDVSMSPTLASRITWLARLRAIQFWQLICLMFGLAIVIGLALTLLPSSTAEMLGKLGRVLSMLFAAVCCLWMTRRAAPGGERLAWACISLGVLGYVLAETFIFTLSLAAQAPLAAGVVAALSAPFYVLGASGVLLLPAVETTGMRLVYMLLDVGVIIGALLGLGFVLLLAPRLAADMPVDYGVLVVPAVDVTAGLAFLVLLVRGVQPTYRSALVLLTITAICFTYGDIGLSYLELPTGNAPAHALPFFDGVWILGAFAVGLAPLSLMIPCSISDLIWGKVEELSSHFSMPTSWRWLGQLLTVATPAGLLFGLLIYVETTPLENATLPLAILAAVVVALVLTRQVLTMRDLVDAHIATARAEQLDALKDQFITSVNHELRTPLMTMKGYLTLLTDTRVQAPQEKRLEMLTRANRSCESLVYLVQSILDTRRIDQEAGNFTPEAVSVQAAMQAALSLVDPREADPSEREITINIPDDLMIWGEAVRLQQILTNLVSNAIKYSPAGAPVAIRAHMLPERTGRLLGSRSGLHLMAEITVQDAGLGIPPEQKALLFRRFVRLPRDIASTVRGTGLGLYLCRVYAEAMGGSISVDSSGVPGEGTIFHVRLLTPPRSTLTLPALAAVSAPEQASGADNSMRY